MVCNSRLYRANTLGIRILAGLLILREKVIRPVLAGIGTTPTCCHNKRTKGLVDRRPKRSNLRVREWAFNPSSSFRRKPR